MDENEKIMPLKDEVLMIYEEAPSKKECVNYISQRYGVPKADVVKLLFDANALDIRAIKKYILYRLLPQMSDEEIQAHARPKPSQEELQTACGFSKPIAPKKKSGTKKCVDTQKIETPESSGYIFGDFKPEEKIVIPDAVLAMVKVALTRDASAYRDAADFVHKYDEMLTFFNTYTKEDTFDAYSGSTTEQSGGHH